MRNKFYMFPIWLALAGALAWASIETQEVIELRGKLDQQEAPAAVTE